MNYTVTPDVIEQLNESGPAWIVGEGEPKWGEYHTVPTPNGKGMQARDAEIAPPADFLAAVEPCAMCDPGDPGFLNVIDGSGNWAKDCPDCIFGKPRLNLMVDCVHGMTQSFAMSKGAICSKCRNTNSIHAATVTAVGDVLPIESNRTAKRDHAHIAVTDDGVTFVWRPGNSFHIITLPANAKPGMFALQVEKVPE